eukprot:TRINITY_DN4267_c0_g1_i1.p1 TRINITY_DN4267_c0_g1~~TRINITY_DN4267_c0_g1_i1.p1  ORF type:complete len:134 (-),score=40.18 TRINITY_DN4267_c0_g1_i1:23-424(-)
MDSLDEVAIPERVRDEVYKFYPDAKCAELKTGGNFPYLSRADEVNMHLQIHLRNHGVIPNPLPVTPVPENGKEEVQEPKEEPKIETEQVEESRTDTEQLEENQVVKEETETFNEETKVSEGEIEENPSVENVE